jgi:hypothetical protein
MAADKVAATADQRETLMKLEAVFMPHATKQRMEIYDKGTNDYARFVHYTSAEAALNIIRSKRIWMRSTMCMSDHREVQHGYDIVRKVLSENENAKRFFAALDASVPGVAEESFKLFDQWWNDIRFSTYITSISEHDDSEDAHGRLSMWRGFGGNNTAPSRHSSKASKTLTGDRRIANHGQPRRVLTRTGSSRRARPGHPECTDGFRLLSNSRPVSDRVDRLYHAGGRRRLHET